VFGRTISTSLRNTQRDNVTQNNVSTSHTTCINLYNVNQEPTKCTQNSTYVFLMWYFHLHVSATNPAIFRLKFLLQEFNVIKNINLLHIWISILWSNLTHLIKLYSCNRNFNLNMVGLAAETCSWKHNNKNTPVELSAFCGFLIQIMQQEKFGFCKLSGFLGTPGTPLSFQQSDHHKSICGNRWTQLDKFQTTTVYERSVPCMQSACCSTDYRGGPVCELQGMKG